MTKRMIAIAVMAIAILAVFSVGDAAQADGGDYAALKKMITENRVGERVKLDANDKLTIPTDPKGGVEYRIESVTIDGSTGTVTTASRGVARFHLPATDAHKDKTTIDGNGIAIYAGTSYHIALDAAQDGFSAYVAVNDSSAPTRYEFGYDLPSGFKLSEDGAGGVEILDSENEVVGDIAPPWAVDANGAAVATAFKLVDDDLIQTIQHSSAAYPVVADPRITLGQGIYVRYDLADDAGGTIDTVKNVIAAIQVGNCTGVVGVVAAAMGTPTAGWLLAAGVAVGATWCGASDYTKNQTHDALEDVRDDLPTVDWLMPDDCTLLVRHRFTGFLPDRIEVENCGNYSRRYYP